MARQAASRTSSRRSSGRSQDQPLDADAVRAAFAELAKEVGGKSPEEIADGFVKIAVENMANAIKKISVQRGYDVTALRAQLLRRRRRPARLPGRRRARHDHGADPSVLVAAVGLRHGARRHPRHAPAGDRGSRSARSRCDADQDAPAPARRGRDARGRRPGRAGRRRSTVHRARAYPLRRHRHRLLGASQAGIARRDAGGASRRRTRRSSASSTASKQLVVEAVVGRGGRRRRQVQRDEAARPPREARPRRRSARDSSRTANGTTPASITREQLSPGHKVDGPGASIIEPHQTDRGRARLAGRDHARRTISC